MEMSKPMSPWFLFHPSQNSAILSPSEEKVEHEMQILRKRELWERLLPQPDRQA